MAGEKTEQATHKRKQDERKKGNVFLSKEVVSIFTMACVFFGLKLLFPNIIRTLLTFIQKYLSMGATQTELSQNDMYKFFFDGVLIFATIALPVLLISVMSNVIITMLQTKMLFSTKAYAFKASHMNPLSGLKKMVSLKSLMELFKSALKITLLIYIIINILKKEIMVLPNLMYVQPIQAMEYTGSIIMTIVMQSSITFVFLSAGDYLFQWWQHMKNMRMSKQEIKDEYKQMEGDPQIKAQIRALQQQRSRQRMMQNVPDADVVIRNPTHFAVAIKYDKSKHTAPVVVAKGADLVALRIIDIAEKNGVHVTENRPLARALFETVEVDEQVHEEHYQAIAEILTFIYNLKKKDLDYK